MGWDGYTGPPRGGLKGGDGLWGEGERIGRKMNGVEGGERTADGFIKKRAQMKGYGVQEKHYGGR